VKAPTNGQETAQSVVEDNVGIVEIFVSSLGSQEKAAFGSDVKQNGQGGKVPNDRVPYQIDLSMILNPEIDTPAQDWPRFGSRIIGVTIGQTCVCPPHYSLKF